MVQQICKKKVRKKLISFWCVILVNALLKFFFFLLILETITTADIFLYKDLHRRELYNKNNSA